jgi:acylphosphatase
VSEVICRRALISGRVQGVYFRNGVRREAMAAGLSGSARNLPDGRVEVVLEGEDAAVDRVIEWCRTGPPGAAVINVEIAFDSVEGRTGFMVL